MTALRLFQFSLLVAGLVGLVSLTQAQGVGTEAKLLLSVSPEEPETGDTLKGDVSAIALRPNAALAFYLYVETKANGQSNLTVKVSSDRAGEVLLAEGSVGTLGANKRVRVKLTPTGALKPVLPAVPTVPVSATDPKAAPPLPGVVAPSTVYVHLFGGAAGKPLDTQTYKVTLAQPRNYINAVVETSTDPKSGTTLTVKLSDLRQKVFRGAPAKARLSLRDDDTGTAKLDPASLKDGTYATTIPPGGTNVQLVAKNLRFADAAARKAKVLLSLDEYERAFVFDADWAGTTATENTKPAVWIDCPHFAVPGKPFAPRLAVANDPTPQEGRPIKPVFKFFRAETGEAEIATGNLATSRDQSIKLDIGKEGELSFATRVRDWEVPLDTAEVYGPRKLSFTLDIPEEDRADDSMNPGKKVPAPSVETLVTFDDTPPTGVRAFDLYQPKKDKKDDKDKSAKKDEKDPPLELREWKKDSDKVRIIRGTRIQFVLSAADAESQIGSMLVFTGPPPLPDGKVAPGGKIYTLKRYLVKDEKGKETPSNPPAWTTIIELPDVKGPFAVNFRVFNRAGLMVEDVAEIMLVDPPPPPTTGTIEGKLIQGSTPERPQPGLTVGLFDAGGKLVASATSNDAGEFKFEELQPGTYLVFSVKEADANASGRQPATVKAGETTTVTVELKR